MEKVFFQSIKCMSLMDFCAFSRLRKVADAKKKINYFSILIKIVQKTLFRTRNRKWKLLRFCLIKWQCRVKNKMIKWLRGRNFSSKCHISWHEMDFSASCKSNHIIKILVKEGIFFILRSYEHRQIEGNSFWRVLILKEQFYFYFISNIK